MSTAAYLSYAGLVTKVRALYGKAMNAQDFAALSAMQNLDEVVAFLRAHPGWRNAMQALPTGYAGRLELEKALALELQSEHTALGHFIQNSDKAFWDFPRHLQDLRRILGDYPHLRSIDELQLRAEGTIYAKSLSQLTGNQLPEFSALEGLLRGRYYTYLYRLITTAYTGDTSQRLKRLLGETADRLNLLALLRLKRYFPQQASLLHQYIPLHHRLSRRFYGQLNAAATFEQALDILRTHPTLSRLAQLSLPDLDLELQNSALSLLRQILRNAEPSIAVAYAYLSYKELMLTKLYSVIETKKYEQSTRGGNA